MNAEWLIQRALLRIRIKNPFFAGLLLYSKIKARPEIGTAATDGADIFYNPVFLENLLRGGVEAVLVHEVLHCALQHIRRRANRNNELWNFAADIVVNGIIAADGNFQLPLGAVRDPEIENFSVEEVYRILERRGEIVPEDMVLDILPALFSNASDAAYWSRAVRESSMIATLSDRGMGDMGVAFDRETSAAGNAQVDWRSELWRQLVRTPCDFTNFDRRFIHNGIYLEGLDGESVKCCVAIDTSGSISQNELGEFLSEIHGILNSYPNIECELFYADAALHGPYIMDRQMKLPVPTGGGGTSFKPLFEYISGARTHYGDLVCIYLTDGFGVFPEDIPGFSVIWVVTPGGMDSQDFPFGSVIRLK